VIVADTQGCRIHVRAEIIDGHGYPAYALTRRADAFKREPIVIRHPHISLSTFVAAA
jgi:hypothetical protein